VGDGDDSIQTHVIESVVHPGSCRFGADPFAPKFFDHAITDLDLVRAVERLKSRRSDDLPRRFPDHRARSESVRLVTRNIKPDSFCKGFGILELRSAKILVHLGIRALFDQRGEIIECKFTEFESFGFDHT
jgi:hypothetical protein